MEMERDSIDEKIPETEQKPLCPNCHKGDLVLIEKGYPSDKPLKYPYSFCGFCGWSNNVSGFASLRLKWWFLRKRFRWAFERLLFGGEK